MDELIETLEDIWNLYEECELSKSESVNTVAALIQAQATIEVARQLGRIADALEKIAGKSGVIFTKDANAV